MGEPASSKPPKPKVVVLTDETMASAEMEKAKQQALREIENYRSPQPISYPRQRQMVQFAKE